MTGADLIPLPDRISDLPDEILHKILGCVNDDKAMIQTSSLSKRWQLIWRSFPELNVFESFLYSFDEVPQPFSGEYMAECRHRFVQWLELLLLNHNMAYVHKLHLCTMSSGNLSLYSVVDRLLARAITCGLKELVLDFDNRDKPFNIYYVLREEIMFSLGSNSLVFLSLEGCLFESFSVGDRLHLPFLKTIVMRDVYIEKYVLPKLMSGCPNVVSLTITECHGLEFIDILHKKIKFLRVECCEELKGFKLDIPTLSCFIFEGASDDDSEFESSTHDISPCFLRTLKISYAKMKAKILNQLVSDFPLMETMSVKYCTVTCTENFQLVSRNKLRQFTLKNCCFQNEVVHQISNTSKWVRIDFKCLQYLSLCGLQIEITNEELKYTVEQSPLLKYLRLKECYMLNEIRFISNSLEELVVEDCFDVQGFRIFAKKLTSFNYVGCPIYNAKFSRVVSGSGALIVHLHLLEEVNIQNNDHHDLGVYWEHFLMIFSPFVEAIRITFGCPKCTEMLKSASECLYVKSLWVRIEHIMETEDLIQVLSGVLRFSLSVENLCMELQNGCRIELTFQKLSAAERHKLINTHEYVRDHLREVRLVRYGGKECERKLVEFLLRKAENLERLSIIPNNHVSINPVRNLELRIWTFFISKKYENIAHIELSS